MSVRMAAVVLAGFLISASGLAAQSLEGPVNLPPAGFDGQQFVDNAGCAFARAGVSGTTVWVARVNQSRDQICGLAPSFGATAVAAAPSAAPRSPILTPGPATNPGAPIPTVASTVPAAAPVPVMAPVAVVAPAAATPAPAAPARRTLAEACEGLTGIQPSLRDARTGAPVDCGGATLAAAPAPAAGPEPLRLTLADACARQAATGVRLIDSEGGQPIVCPTTVATVATVAAVFAPAQAAPRSLTRAAACAEQAATGVALQDAATGAPIACPQPTMMAEAPTFTTSTLAQTVAQTVAAQRGDPLSAATLSGTLAAGPVSPIRVGDPLSAETISGVVTQIHYGPPAGYEPVWTDGRLNPNRGLPEIQAQVPVAAHPAAGDRVSTMSVPQPQAVASGGFVQVGTYGDPANAARAEATLRNLGLPVAVSTLTRNGAALQVVAAGPIAAADLDAALRAARAAGYGDAYIR